MNTPSEEYWGSAGDLEMLVETCPKITLKEVVAVAHVIFGVKLRIVFSKGEYEEGTVAISVAGSGSED